MRSMMVRGACLQISVLRLLTFVPPRFWLAPTEDDYDIFQSRVSNLPEVSIYLSGSAIPQAERQPLPGTRPHNFSPLMRSAIEGHSGNSSTSYDSQSLYSSASRSPASKATSIHLIASSDTTDQSNGGDTATIGGRSVRTNKTAKTLEQQALMTGVPVHKLAFNEFHNQVSPASTVCRDSC